MNKATEREISDLGRTITKLRQAKRWSLSRAAAEAGISRQHLWKIENGAVANPSTAMVERLASAFQISLAQLLGQSKPSRGEEVLRRLLACSDKISASDWALLEEIARRVTLENLKR